MNFSVWGILESKAKKKVDWGLEKLPPEGLGPDSENLRSSWKISDSVYRLVLRQKEDILNIFWNNLVENFMGFHLMYNLLVLNF